MHRIALREKLEIKEDIIIVTVLRCYRYVHVMSEKLYGL